MRSLVALLGLLAITWLEFQFYPGHTYLKGETQFYVPMLERLDAPGFLSRDLVATNPTFAYTIYDEVTLALHQYARLPFQTALESQQLLFRFAAVLGIYLLARSAGLNIASSLLLTCLTNAIGMLTSPGVFVTNPEAVPSAFALGLTLLAGGLLADEKPLLGGVAAGLALIYEPLIGGAFWLLILTAMAFDKKVRPLFRATLPSLLVFGLMLANLSQLQAGPGSVKSLGSRLSPALEQLSRMRTPELWPSLWAHEIWSYPFLFVVVLWAAVRLGQRLTRPARWLAVGLACLGLLDMALSALWLDGFHLSLLALTAAMAGVLCGIAAWHSRRKEAVCWSLMALCIAINPQILNLPRLPVRDTTAVAAPVRDLAAWANRDTWGSAIFLFPDAGQSAAPGAFRALSRRALWTDWQSGWLVNYSEEAGMEWWKRWQQTMRPVYSAARIQGLLSLPIDYIVVEPRHRFKGIRAVFENENFAAYDTQDLRNATEPLQ